MGSVGCMGSMGSMGEGEKRRTCPACRQCAATPHPTHPAHPAHPRPQEQVRVAAVQLQEANARYNQLQAERSSSGVAIDAAAVELADANSRFQQLKRQLEDEQAQRALLQVRGGDAWLGGCKACSLANKMLGFSLAWWAPPVAACSKPLHARPASGPLKPPRPWRPSLPPSPQRQNDEVSAAARAERVEAQARLQEVMAHLAAEREQREALQVRGGGPRGVRRMQGFCCICF